MQSCILSNLWNVVRIRNSTAGQEIRFPGRIAAGLQSEKFHILVGIMELHISGGILELHILVGIMEIFAFWSTTVRMYGSGGALEGAAREGPYKVRPGRGLRRCGPGGV